jgi:hypothetical protein
MKPGFPALRMTEPGNDRTWEVWAWCMPAQYNEETDKKILHIFYHEVFDECPAKSRGLESLQQIASVPLPKF